MNYQNQWSALLYLISVLLPVCLVAWRAQKKERFALRFPLSLLGIAGLQALMMVGINALYRFPELQYYMIWAYSIRFLAVYLLSAVLVKACFEADWWGALFSANLGYCIQHIGARAGDALLSLLPLENAHWAVTALLSECVNLAVTGVFWLVLIRKFPKNQGLRPENRIQVGIAALVCGFAIVYNSFGITFATQCADALQELGADPAPANGSMMFVYVTSVLIAFLTLALNLGMSHNKLLADENSALELLLAESRRQYEREKRNIESVNIKCHDLKHKIGAMKGKLYEEEIEELGQVLNVYDSSIKTGNETLDLILSQKTLYCTSHGIRLTCLLDGTNYAFIPRHELYSLFDNAIDNSIEAVEQLPEEQRVISVTEEKRGSFLSVCVENFYSGSVKMEDGMPQSEKPGEGHGYGVKSIRMIAERNGGDISISCENGVFSLSVYFLAA